jgi:hypothetical protein
MFLTDFIPDFLIGIAVLLLVTLFVNFIAACIKEINNAVDIVIGKLIGLFIIICVTAVTVCGFETIFLWPLLVVFIYFIYNIKGLKKALVNISMPKLFKKIGVETLIISGVGLLFSTYLISPDHDFVRSVNSDFLFYSNAVEGLLDFKVENPMGSFNLLKEQKTVQYYHYAELWLAAIFCKFGVNSVIALICFSYPIFLVSTLALMTKVLIVNLKKINFPNFIIVFGLLMYTGCQFNLFLGDEAIYYQNMISESKLAYLLKLLPLLYIIAGFTYLFFNNKIMGALIILLLGVYYNFLFLPFYMLMTLTVILLNREICQKSIKTLLFLLISVSYVVIFYFVLNKSENSNTVFKDWMLTMDKSWLHTAVLQSFDMILAVLLTFPLLIISLFYFSIKLKEFSVSAILFFIFSSGIVISALMYNFMNGFQFLQIAVSLIILIGVLFVSMKNKWILIILAGVGWASIFTTVTNDLYGDFSRITYSSKFIQELENEKNMSKIGVSLSDMKRPRTSNPQVGFLGKELILFDKINANVTVALEYAYMGVDQSKYYGHNRNNSIKNSEIVEYIANEKLNHIYVDTDLSIYRFIKKNDINFMLIDEGLDIPASLDSIVIKSFQDEYSKVWYHKFK